MQDADLSASEIVAASFDLPTSDAGGTGRGVVLDDASLAWNSKGSQRRRKFDDIAAIDLEAIVGGDDPSVRCDIRFTDGAELTLHMEETTAANAVLRYRRCVLQLFERLGPARRARIVFQAGARPAARVQFIIASALGVVLFLALLVFSPFWPELRQEDAWWIVPVMALLGLALCAVGLRQAWNSGRKPFDPAALPKRALPPAPTPRPQRKRR